MIFSLALFSIFCQVFTRKKALTKDKLGFNYFALHLIVDNPNNLIFSLKENEI